MKLSIKESTKYKKIKQFKKGLMIISVTIGILSISKTLTAPTSARHLTTTVLTYNDLKENSNTITPGKLLKELLQQYEKKENPEEVIKEPIEIVPENGYVAITYDDGPSKLVTPQTLQLLNEYNCKATFFVLGENAEKYPDITLQICKNGNELGNHGYDHTRFSILSNEQINYQINKTDNIIFNIINETPTFVRTPYGEFDNRICSIIENPIALWSIDSNDWRDISVDTIVDNIMNEIKDGSVILLHDINTKSLEVSKKLIPKIKDAGYGIITLKELFEKDDINLEKRKIYTKTK